MNDYSQDHFTREALQFVEQNKDRSFFLYYPVIIPHDNGEALPGKRYSEVPSFGIYADSTWTEEEKGYAAMITHLDGEIGKLLDKLNELGLDENTIIFFTSDNGGDSPGRFRDISNFPFRGLKRDLYEGGIRVPLIARWKGTIARVLFLITFQPSGIICLHSASWQEFLFQISLMGFQCCLLFWVTKINRKNTNIFIGSSMNGTKNRQLEKETGKVLETTWPETRKAPLNFMTWNPIPVRW
jgi:hypothetical protein